MSSVTQVRFRWYMRVFAMPSVLCLWWLQACAVEPDAASMPLALIGGMPAPGSDASVWIAHADGAPSCSGALIAPTLVLTALHCTLDPRTEAALRADGFVVGFGAARDRGELRTVVSVERIPDAQSTSLAEHVARGEDVALLWLVDPAPASAHAAAVQLDYVPRSRDAYYLSGFGLESTNGANGRRLRAAATLSGLDPSTGVLQLEGATACFGDSGGPVVLQRRNALVGVIGQIASDEDAGACALDLTFGYSVINVGVRTLLADACGSLGGCGEPTDAGDEDAAVSVVQTDSGSDAGDAATAGPGREPDASRTSPSAPARRKHSGGCACSGVGSRPVSGLVVALVGIAWIAASMRWRSRKP